MDYLNCDGVIIRPFEGAVDNFFSSLSPESIALFDRCGHNKKKALSFIDTPARNKAYFLAELDGEMLGYVFFFDNEKKVPGVGLVVADKAQGMHLGTRLMKYAIDYAKNIGKGGIYLTTGVCNLRAQMLYEKSGFEFMGQYKNGKEYFYLLRFDEE